MFQTFFSDKHKKQLTSFSVRPLGNGDPAEFANVLSSALYTLAEKVLGKESIGYVLKWFRDTKHEVDWTEKAKLVAQVEHGGGLILNFLTYETLKKFIREANLYDLRLAEVLIGAAKQEIQTHAKELKFKKDGDGYAKTMTQKFAEYAQSPECRARELRSKEEKEAEFMGEGPVDFHQLYLWNEAVHAETPPEFNDPDPEEKRLMAEMGACLEEGVRNAPPGPSGEEIGSLEAE